MISNPIFIVLVRLFLTQSVNLKVEQADLEQHKSSLYDNNYNVPLAEFTRFAKQTSTSKVISDKLFLF